MMAALVSTIDDWIRNYFSEKAIIDDRMENPLTTISIPNTGLVHLIASSSLFSNNNTDDEEVLAFEIYAPNMTAWYQMGFIQFTQGLMAMVLACIIYYGVIPNRNTPTAYVLGWGVIIPVSAYIPVLQVEYFDSYNRFVNLPATFLMGCIGVRCMSAMYIPTTPNYIEHSLTNYMVHCSTLGLYQWDDTTQAIAKANIRDTFVLLLEILFFFMVSSVLVSWMIVTEFKPFESTVRLNQFDVGDMQIFHPHHLLNSYLHIWVLYSTFKIGFEAVGLVENLKGYATDRVFYNPLTQSSSVTEFWNVRWNRLIHNLLKYGVFKPAVTMFSPLVSVAVTFLGSGLFHDYCWQVVFYNPTSKFDPRTGECLDTTDPNYCYTPIFGRCTVFFVYVGAIMILQRPVSKLWITKWCAATLPTIVITQLLLIIHLPFVHWYGGDWMMGGFYDHLAIALFKIKRI